MAAIHGERARCYQILGRTAAAIDGYSAAIQQDPQDGNWWLERGELLLRLDQREQGCRDILHGQTLLSTTYAGDTSGCLPSGADQGPVVSRRSGRYRGL